MGGPEWLAKCESPVLHTNQGQQTLHTSGTPAGRRMQTPMLTRVCVYLSAADEFGAQCPTAVAAQNRMLGIRDTITQIDSTRPWSPRPLWCSQCICV